MLSSSLGKYKINVRVINLLAAFIIGLFIVFPEIIREFETDNQVPSPNFQFEHQPDFNNRPPIPPDRRNDQMFEKNPNFQMDRPPVRMEPNNNSSSIIYNFLLFFLLSYILVFINTRQYFNFPIIKIQKNTLPASIAYTFLVGILIFGIIYFIGQYFGRRQIAGFFFLNGMIFFKILFSSLTAILFGHIIRLINKQQEFVVENERLKSENIQNRFNALTSQMNPHFFFNSLNSLSSLIRENELKKSLRYISELSDIFRYILKRNWKEVVPLYEELKIIEAYMFLLEIRYEGKLVFEINIDENYINNYVLPALSVQPLIENAVKHNVVSKQKPLKITISINGNEELVVSNAIQKKLDNRDSTGIGLNNLENRYQLLINKSITIAENNNIFSVGLPLLKSENYESNNN